MPHSVFDLHCDTLTTHMGMPGGSLFQRSGDFSLLKLPAQTQWVQCTAVFLPDTCSPEQRLARYEACLRELRQQQGEDLSVCRSSTQVEAAWGAGKAAAILTVENGSLLCGRLTALDRLAADGVRMMTLTWNGVNEIGSGHQSEAGLTPFGKALLPRMEDLGVVVDVSHLNDQGFRDVLDGAEKPFAASHSNARAICPHPRNLTDWQLREMICRHCLIGLTFYSPFLRSDGQPAAREDLLRHAEHILDLGGEDCLALGGDLDGADLPPELDGAAAEAGLWDFFREQGYPEGLTAKLMYRNALSFFRS